MKKLCVLTMPFVLGAAFSGDANAIGGTLQFQGELTHASCAVKPGGDASAGSGDEILIHMGNVSFAGLETARPGNGDVGVTVADIDFSIGCPSASDRLDTVVMHFDPATGSGLDPVDSRLLAFTPGGARGAAIALVNSDNDIIDMSRAPSVRTPLNIDKDGVATANIALRATYLKTAGTAVPGVANASLPFVLRYE
ncbi:TPA: type 1 fimbrial protein [Pseudomonas putida]|nr:type 1 fimbrial protein [Pseudomonas putida]